MSAKERNKSRRSTMRYFVSKAGWMSFLAANEDEAQELRRANEDEDQELQTTAKSRRRSAANHEDWRVHTMTRRSGGVHTKRRDRCAEAACHDADASYDYLCFDI